MASMMKCMTLQQSTSHLRSFDGKNTPLWNFLQNTVNCAVYINRDAAAAYIKAILSKLVGEARESVRIKTFSSQWSNHYIPEEYCTQGADRNVDATESEYMIEPILSCALDSFARGFPSEISTFVYTRNPKDLSAAYAHALHIEEKLKTSLKKEAKNYHVTTEDATEKSSTPILPYSRDQLVI